LEREAAVADLAINIRVGSCCRYVDRAAADKPISPRPREEINAAFSGRFVNLCPWRFSCFSGASLRLFAGYGSRQRLPAIGAI
jgi:hypothetical protein